ncbi:FLOT1 protein, partial [Rhinopomastus cyanomelas]|nr:FLOT1 protein [Rhinopomastus cyanomelas]
QEIYKDRQKFSEQVFNVASSDLVNMGISVVSYTLKDIHDDQSGTLTRGPHRCHGGCRLWGSSGSPSLTGAGGVGRFWVEGHPQLETLTRGSGGCWVQVARTQQQIAEQRAQVQVVERAQRVQLQEQEVGRREKELEATVRKPAEAERFRLERLAEAQR